MSLATNPTIKTEKYQTIIDNIIDLYISDERPIACGYSGGKDSTVALDLVIKALMQINNPTKPVFVQFSDTLMEMSNTEKSIHDSLERLKKFAKTHSLPIIIKKVQPVTSETFFSLVIGKGYQLPSELRWCTDRMKIRPQNRLSEEYNEMFPNGMIACVGSRKEESEERSERLTKKTIKGMYKTHDLPKWNMIAPIENFTTDEIWDYIYTSSSLWISAIELGKVYADASDDGDECRTMLEGTSGEKAGCGKSARYGCWVCPKVYSKDKALINLGKKYAYMKKQEAFRNWLIAEGQGWKNRRNYRNDNQGRKKYNMGNHRDGMTMPSGYTLEFRKEILTRLWKLNNEIKADRNNKDLISYDELVFIQNEWLKEGDIELSVEKITGLKIEGVDKRLLSLSKVLNEMLIIKPDENSMIWFESYYNGIPFEEVTMSTRFITTLVAELIKNGKNDKEIVLFFDDLMIDDYWNKNRTNAHKEYMQTKTATKKFFPNETKKTLIKKEWESDEVSFVTFMDNKLYNKIVKPDDIEFTLGGDYNKAYKKAQKEFAPFESVYKQYEEYTEKGDIINCESISLADKMAWFD